MVPIPRVDGLGEWKCRIKQNSGRKKKGRDEIAARIRAVPIEERKPYRRLAHAAGISKHLVQALIREGILTVHSTRIKPYLTDTNKFRRMEHALTFIDPTSLMFEPIRRSKNHVPKTMFLAAVARPR
ncbi:hypothetical protein PC129_g11871 [Phytophthora cactorum]|uniref:Uncharacterized protein n=1 Tax=Phytophthora cactorum TaxID=29920 RepID=A0A8T1HZB8_9STRA|nr:hypothetical protein PC114_g14869 [Phytophthora cactorum]KAG3188414.1 hypothetical protein C6341_g2810 [Phytophthora cactorum]KAG3217297.1 hypothetical protein PC129_g11871 [Phytophthora cactorum]